MEIPFYDATDRQLARLAVRLAELAAWRDREFFSIPEARFRTRAEPDWRTITLGERWPGRDCPVHIQLACKLPESWAGWPVHGRFDLGGEALLFVDGSAVGGLNPLHAEHRLVPAAGRGQTVLLEAEVVPYGPFGTPNREPRFQEACVLVPDFGIRSLHDDLAAALDAAVYLNGSGRREIAARIGDAIQNAFVRIQLPRSEPEEYLARLAHAAAHDRAAELVEHTESLEAIWEDWSFDAAPAPLPEGTRTQLEAIRLRFAAELDQIRELYPPEGRVWLTGHAHIDLAWLWPLEETRRKLRRTFYTILSLMESYPHLYFNQSSAQVYAWIEQDDPELFEKIRQKVQEGRWELSGGMWVEPDGNLPAGESWVRQILFGQRYFQSRFGRRPTVAWLPDSFGFTGNLPQLLLSGGLPFFFTQKLTWSEVNFFPYDLYHWEGLDGSRVLAHSFFNPPRGYNGRIDAHDTGSTWRNFRGKRFHDTTLLAVGHGDGGGGPTSQMLERFERLKGFPGLPQLRMGAVSDFYRQIPAGIRNLPVWVGEQYLEFHRATYTSQALIKALHRRLEQAVVETEAAATLAFALAKHPYPQEELRQIWETLLLNEFHDILPGSSIRSVNETAGRQLRLALEKAEALRRNVLTPLQWQASEAVPGSRDLVLWNLSLSSRPLVVEIPETLDDQSRLRTADGRELAFQKTENGCLIGGDVQIEGLSPLSIRSESGEPRPVASPLRATPRQLENEYLKIQVSGAGCIESIYDKDAGREVLAGRANQLWIYTDIPRRFDAWDIDESYPLEGTELQAASEPELVESGPLRAAIRIQYELAGIKVTQLCRLGTASRRLDFVTRIRWATRRTLLRALFPVNVRTHEMWAETAFGAVARPTHRNTTWDQAKFEVPAHRWTDLSEPGYGVSLLSDSKYGYSVEANVLGISLLRSPIYPDPHADRHEHSLTYSLYPHPGDWRTGGTLAAAQELNAPLTVLPSTRVDRSPTPFFSLVDGSIQLAALKKAEDSDDIIVRLFEPYGSRGQVTLRSGLPLRSAYLVNILEENLSELEVKDETSIRLCFTPFQVISLKLTIAEHLT
ncbi:MAG: alpha-mannosidase [Verrucomicrobia bacterium]|nr:alpha-mannosidase [Verrucomicrobiota bacterium]